MRLRHVIVLPLLLSCSEAKETTLTAPSAAQPSLSASGIPATGAAATAAPQKPPPKRADPSRLTLQGKPVQGGLMYAKIDDPKTRGVKFPGHRVVIGEDGSFLIAFFYKAPAKETLTLTFPNDEVLEHTFEVEQRTYDDEAIDGIPEKFITLPPKRAKKMRADTKRIELARKRYTKRAYYREGCFEWPAVGKITSRFGAKRTFNKKKKDMHWGVDVARPVGSPVKAPCGGIVRFAEPDIPLAGNMVIIDHGHGLSSTLIHLQAIRVKVGDEVKTGDVVATVGMTGRTTGPHLDWRMNFFTIRIDSELLAPPMPN